MKLSLFLVFAFSLSSVFSFDCPHEGDGAGSFSEKSTVMIDESGIQRIWNKEDSQNLTYCLSPKFKELKSLMVSALKIATEDWMDAANVKFEYRPELDVNCDRKSGPDTRFRISLNRSRRYPFAARAFFPYDERNTITFKKSYVEKSFQELLRLTRHELGHVLGLRHEHIRQENPLSERCQEDQLFSAVTDYDRNSIMHYSQCGGTGTVEISNLDRVGIAKLYPY